MSDVRESPRASDRYSLAAALAWAKKAQECSHSSFTLHSASLLLAWAWAVLLGCRGSLILRGARHDGEGRAAFCIGWGKCLRMAGRSLR
jgi:hypothetical protein